MAELIRKDKLIDWSYRVPQYYDSMNDRTDMRDFINGLPTTTEAEIRAMAISEFAEALYKKSTDLKYIGSDDYGMLRFAEVYEIAEELKGGGD